LPAGYDPALVESVREAFARLNSKQAVADELGLSWSKVKRVLKSISETRLGQGSHEMLPGFAVSKVSTLHNREGEVVAQWVQQRPEKEEQEAALKAVIDAMAADLPRIAPIDAPILVNPLLLTQYTFTDFHLGALCWRKEGGADWDVSIAEATGNAAMQAMVAGAPSADTAIVNIQGDWLHADGLVPVTPSHGHVLDADSRFGRVVEVSIRLIRRLVALAAEKHRRVILLICEGNHDPTSSLWLRKLFGALYENEPRVTVHDSELPYYALQWGKVMLGYHHGHLRKNAELPLLFAAQFAPMWGETTKRYINTGHRHHKEDKEHAGCRVIQHPTLAARDAYAARGGWISERAITAMTFHQSYGEVGTVTISPEMLEAV